MPFVQILEDSLKEMQDLQESTADFEKQIAIMEGPTETRRCLPFARQIEVLEASKAANLQAMNEVPPPHEIIAFPLTLASVLCV